MDMHRDSLSAAVFSPERLQARLQQKIRAEIDQLEQRLRALKAQPALHRHGMIETYERLLARKRASLQACEQGAVSRLRR